MVTIEGRHFSIPQICGSGQCFRLDAVSEDIYELFAGGRYLKIRAARDGDAGGKTILYCTEEEYKEFWEHYFDLDSSYSGYIGKIDGQDAYLKEAAAFGSGIRILRQDIWEMIVTFILSQQNNNFLCFAILSSGETGIRTPGTSQYNGFQDRRNRPLCHLSKTSFSRSAFLLKRCKDSASFLIRKQIRNKIIHISVKTKNTASKELIKCY